MMPRHMSQDTFNYGAAVVALLRVYGVPTNEVRQQLQKVCLNYADAYAMERPSDLFGDWLASGEQLEKLSQSFFHTPDIQGAFLEAFKWYVSYHDQEGKPRSLLGRVFNGVFFNYSPKPLQDRVKKCVTQGAAYAVGVRMGTAPLPPRNWSPR